MAEKKKSGAWLLDTAERSVRTFAQALIGYMTAAGLTTGVSWGQALAGAGFATLYSFLMSLTGYAATGTPSLLPRKMLPAYKPIRAKQGQEDS